MKGIEISGLVSSRKGKKIHSGFRGRTTRVTKDWKDWKTREPPLLVYKIRLRNPMYHDPRLWDAVRTWDVKHLHPPSYKGTPCTDLCPLLSTGVPLHGQMSDNTLAKVFWWRPLTQGRLIVRTTEIWVIKGVGWGYNQVELGVKITVLGPDLSGSRKLLKLMTFIIDVKKISGWKPSQSGFMSETQR